MECPPEEDVATVSEAQVTVVLPPVAEEAQVTGGSSASSGLAAVVVPAVAVPAMRADVSQHIMAYFKLYLPPNAHIVHDAKINYRFVVTLDQTKLLEVDPSAVAALPPGYNQRSKSFPFKKGAGLDPEEIQFELALTWVWAKHVRLFGGERPGWSFPRGTPCSSASASAAASPA